jgi:hypothetical protein
MLINLALNIRIASHDWRAFEHEKASFELLPLATKQPYATRRYENLDVGVRFDFPGFLAFCHICLSCNKISFVWLKSFMILYFSFRLIFSENLSVHEKVMGATVSFIEVNNQQIFGKYSILLTEITARRKLAAMHLGVYL